MQTAELDKSIPTRKLIVPQQNSYYFVDRPYQQMMHQIGLAESARVFDHPDIRVWRSIPERENATVDVTVEDRPIRLHVKRYRAVRGRWTPADAESAGIMLLQRGGIPTVPLVASGRLDDGRSFIITEDLAGYDAADKLLERGLPFDQILESTADLAAKLHNARLHHRDLYLCHFFVNPETFDVRLIDAARVAQLGLFPLRWIVKDLAQFWYSILPLPISDAQRSAWLERYAQQRGLSSVQTLRNAIQRKVQTIARHDEKLRAKQPERNISIPRDEV